VTRLHVVALVSGALAAAAIGWRGPRSIAHWRADRTAQLFTTAVFEADSLRIARLTKSGSAQNVLCARRLWPAAFWMMRDGRPLHARRGKSYDGSYGYETVGDSLPLHNGRRAVFQFYIAPGNPTKVHTLFADSRTGVWNDTVRACVSEWPR